MTDEMNPSTRGVPRESAVAEALVGDLDLYQDLREKDFSMECQNKRGGTVVCGGRTQAMEVCKL